MENESVKVEIIDFKSTYVEVKFLTNGHKIKMGKQFFEKRVNAGFYEVVNQQKIPSVL